MLDGRSLYVLGCIVGVVLQFVGLHVIDLVMDRQQLRLPRAVARR